MNDKARFIKKRRHARDKAMQALYQWQLSGEDLDWIRDHYQQDQGVAAGDEEYFLELLYQIPPQADAILRRCRFHSKKTGGEGRGGGGVVGGGGASERAQYGNLRLPVPDVHCYK